MSDEQMHENEGAVTGQEAFENIGEDDLTPDQKRIAEWHEAVRTTPTSEDVDALRQAVKDAKEALETSTAAYEEAVALRGRVYGWRQVADAEGITTKKLHLWRAAHINDLPDLSTIPEKEMKREERRIEQATERFEREKALREKVLAQKARLDSIREGFNR